MQEIDLGGKIVAPGFLELQTNGLLGFHFTHYEDDEQYQSQLRRVSKYLITKGVTGFWATVPTVSTDTFQKILPSLRPQNFENAADLLGAHTEGPYLAPSKKGAHDESLFHTPETCSAETVYGADNLQSSVKLVTLSPELPGALALVHSLCTDHDIRVSLGHSAADFETGAAGLEKGATALTHVFNAMNPLHHRIPGLVGLVASPLAPYYSVIPDGIHLHAATLAMAYRANPKKCILITDSIELAGLPDGVHPGHSQIPYSQRKIGNKVTIDGTETLIGSCSSLDECVRNLVNWARCGLAEAVRCVTENVVGLMGDSQRGVLESGRRADFVVLSDEGDVLQTWVRGRKVYPRP
ncbi:MAG: hypothetical protein M1837_005926 [Sclerophora amabilis]|nr:MAG: hypothetical protein M1837_005926 [Sclerophora amabilis]